MSRAEEARLLHALLFAAEEEQRVVDVDLLAQWHVLKLRFNRTRAERTHAALVVLFEKLERTEIFTGTWIEDRWLKAKAQRTRKSASLPRREYVTHK